MIQLSLSVHARPHTHSAAHVHLPVHGTRRLKCRRTHNDSEEKGVAP